MDTDSAAAVSLASLSPPPNESKVKTIKKSVDQGYAWVIMIAVSVTFMTAAVKDALGTLYYQAFLVQFNLNATTAGLLLSVGYGIRMMGSPFVGLLYQKFTFRTVAMAGSMLFTLGILLQGFATNLWTLYIATLLVAIGDNCVVLTSYVVLPFYFSRLRCMALAFTLCGYSTGSMIFPPLVTRSFNNFGYKQTFVFIACLIMQCLVTTALYKSQFVDSSSTVSEQNHSKSRWQSMKHALGLNLLQKPLMVHLLVVIALVKTIHTIVTIYVSGLAIERANMSSNQIATTVSIGAFCEFSKLLIGFCFDRRILRPYRLYLYCIGGIGTALIVILLTFTSDMITFTVCYVSYVICWAGTYSQNVIMLGDMVTTEELPIAITLSRTIMGISQLLLPPMVGRIKDVWNSYQYGFILYCMIHTCGVLSYVIVYFCWRRYQTKHSDKTKTCQFTFKDETWPMDTNSVSC